MGEAGRKREIWLLGTASERCREELNALGFDIHEDVAASSGTAISENSG